MTKEKLEGILRSVEVQKKDNDLFSRDGTYCRQKLLEYDKEASDFLHIMEGCGRFTVNEIQEEKKLLDTVKEALKFYGVQMD